MTIGTTKVSKDPLNYIHVSKLWLKYETTDYTNSVHTIKSCMSKVKELANH